MWKNDPFSPLQPSSPTSSGNQQRGGFARSSSHNLPPPLQPVVVAAAAASSSRNRNGTETPQFRNPLAKSIDSAQSAPVKTSQQMQAVAKNFQHGVGNGQQMSNDDHRLTQVQQVGRNGNGRGNGKQNGNGNNGGITPNFGRYVRGRGRGDTDDEPRRPGLPTPTPPAERMITAAMVRDSSSSGGSSSGDSFVVPAPSDYPPKIGGMASINGIRFGNKPVFTVAKISDDRLHLRSIGLPHLEMDVLYKCATFNNLPLHEFRIEDVLQVGDHVLVENITCWYDGRSRIGGGLIWRAMAIGFPRYTTGLLHPGARWITQGRIQPEKYSDPMRRLVDTGFHLENTFTQVLCNYTITVYAPRSAFQHEYPPFDSTVVTRARLDQKADEAFTKMASGEQTPWKAECVTAVGGGIKEGRGYLKRDRYSRDIQWQVRTTTVVSPGFGYIYIPNELITNEIYYAEDNVTPIKFRACINRDIGNRDKLRKLHHFKWRAVSVEINQPQHYHSKLGRIVQMDKEVVCHQCQQKMMCICK